MPENKSIILISMNEDWIKKIKSSLLKLDRALFIKSAYSRADAIEFINSVKSNYIIIEDSFELRDLKVVIRSIANSINNKETNIFFIYKDFNNFQNVVSDYELKNILSANIRTSIDAIAKIIVNNIDSLTVSKEKPKAIIPEDVPKSKLGVGKGIKIIDTDNSSKLKKKTKTISKKKIDTELINVFIDATMDVINEMVPSCDLKYSAPQILKDCSIKDSIAIRGRIDINSKSFKGSFYISFPANTYLKMYNAVLGESNSEINNENQDFAKELANIIYGKSKLVLNSLGHNLEMVIPMLDKSTKIEEKGPTIAIPYTSKYGSFYIKVTST